MKRANDAHGTPGSHAGDIRGKLKKLKMKFLSEKFCHNAKII